MELHNGHQLKFVRTVDRVEQKLVLMMDVIEHVDDDVGLIRQYVKGMSPDAFVVITVPAFQFLWSGHDVFLEHRRRYTRSSLERVVGAAGLICIRSRYFFGFLLPFVIMMRLLDRLRLGKGDKRARSALKQYPQFLNTALGLLHDIERRTLFRCNSFAGLSIFCLAKRRESMQGNSGLQPR